LKKYKLRGRKMHELGVVFYVVKDVKKVADLEVTVVDDRMIGEVLAHGDSLGC
jgi:hypothetical protein